MFPAKLFLAIMTETEIIFAFILLGYLIGSFPSGLVYTRLSGMEDIRTIGSGNIGATNVLRTGNKKIALATLFTDILKGGIFGAYLSNLAQI